MTSRAAPRLRAYRDVWWFRRYFSRHIRPVLGALAITYVGADVRGTGIRLLGEVTTGIATPATGVAAGSIHTITGWLVASLEWSATTQRARVLVAVGVLLVIGSLITLARDLIRQRVASAIKQSLRGDLLASLAAEPADERRERGAGASLALYGNDVDVVGRHVGNTTETMLESALQFVVYAALIVGSTDGRAGAALVAAFIALLAAGRFAASWATGRAQERAFAAQDLAQRTAMSTTARVFDVFRELVFLGSDKRIGEQTTARWSAIDRASGHILVWTGLGAVFSETAQQLSLPIILAVVAASSASTVGSVLGVTLMLAQMAGPLGALLAYPDSLRRVGPNLAKLRQALSVSPAPRISSDAESLATTPQPAAIRFEHVRIRFPGMAVDALRDVTLEIPAGTRVAIVGRSGSGKTTLARALMGDQPIADGRIVVDDVDITGWPLAWRRALIAFVPSPPGYLLDTIRANVIFGRDVSPSRYDQSLRVSSLENAIAKQPRGDETALTAEVSLSVGEQRRVALARGLCSSQRILVLDEPTAQLDAETLAEVGQQLMEFTAGRTCVFVTNDPALAALCDRAYLVENGEVRAVPAAFAQSWVTGYRAAAGTPAASSAP